MAQTEAQATERALSFLRINERPPKPRQRGMTEIRGPYYTPLGKRYLQDLLETMGAAIDSLKFAGGSFAVMPREAVKELIDLCHAHDVLVSTGGFIEYVLTQGTEAVRRYIEGCRELGFDTIEISSGFITLPTESLLRLVEQVQEAGLKAKAEVGIQFGAGGASAAADLEAAGGGAAFWPRSGQRRGPGPGRDPEGALAQAKRLLEAGAFMIMLESEGITEGVTTWRTEVTAQFVNALGLERVMLEAADPAVFACYVKNYGPDVNLFVDHSQIVHLECLRSGIWGTQELWGRVLTYPK